MSFNVHLIFGNSWCFYFLILLFNANSAICQLYHGENKLIFNEMMMMLCTMPTCLVGFVDSASSPRQQSEDRHVDPLRPIILIPSQPVFALSPECFVLSGEETNTNLIVFGLTSSGSEPTIHCTWGEHASHYTTAAVYFLIYYNVNIHRIYWLLNKRCHTAILKRGVIIVSIQVTKTTFIISRNAFIFTKGLKIPT